MFVASPNLIANLLHLMLVGGWSTVPSQIGLPLAVLSACLLCITEMSCWTLYHLAGQDSSSAVRFISHTSPSIQGSNWAPSGMDLWSWGQYNHFWSIVFAGHLLHRHLCDESTPGVSQVHFDPRVELREPPIDHLHLITWWDPKEQLIEWEDYLCQMHPLWTCYAIKIVKH